MPGVLGQAGWTRESVDQAPEQGFTRKEPDLGPVMIPLKTFMEGVAKVLQDMRI